jgi:hypothetical protein
MAEDGAPTTDLCRAYLSVGHFPLAMLRSIIRHLSACRSAEPATLFVSLQDGAVQWLIDHDLASDPEGYFRALREHGAYPQAGAPLHGADSFGSFIRGGPVPGGWNPELQAATPEQGGGVGGGRGWEGVGGVPGSLGVAGAY